MTTPRRLVALCALGASFSATAQIAVSVNDNKMALDNGMPKVAADAPAGVSINRAGTLALVANRGDGSHVAVVVMGKLVPCMMAGKTLQKPGEPPLGNWSQAVAFAPGESTALAQNMVQKDIQVSRIDGMRLLDTGQRTTLKGGGAALRTAGKPR